MRTSIDQFAVEIDQVGSISQVSSAFPPHARQPACGSAIGHIASIKGKESQERECHPDSEHASLGALRFASDRICDWNL